MLFFIIFESLFLICLILCRRENGKNVFQKMAVFIYRKKVVFSSPANTAIFDSLYVPARVEQVKREFYIKKIEGVLLTIFIGNVFMIVVCLCSRIDGTLINGAQILRNTWGAGSREVVLDAESEGKISRITWQVAERRYTQTESEEMEKEVAQWLRTGILGKNESSNRITGNLQLVRSVENYPFSIYWESSDYSYVRSDGTVDLKQVTDQGKQITLTATLRYEAKEWKENYTIWLFPMELTEVEKWKQSILNSLNEEEEKTATDSMLTLPVQIQGKRISWKIDKTRQERILFIFICLIGVLIFFLPDQQIRQQLMGKKEELISSYPEFISKLTLYLGAGLSIRKSLERMAMSFEKEKEFDQRKGYLYEEMILSVHEYENGISEREVLEAFGRRCNEMPYRRCCALLTGNLRSGNEKLLSCLKAEAQEAIIARKQKALRLGEEAETKLLLPMILMLILVMVLIMIPAYFSFS